MPNKVMALIEARGTNMSRVAAAIGVDASQFTKWMKGRAKPTVAGLLALARHLGTSVEYLADDAIDAEPPSAELPRDEQQVLELYRALREDPAEGMTAREAMRRLRRPSLAKDTGAAPGESYGETRKPRKPINGSGDGRD